MSNQEISISVQVDTTELGHHQEEFLISIDEEPFKIITTRYDILRSELLFLDQNGESLNLVDFGDMYNKTSIDRTGVLYNSSPVPLRWVAVNKNDAPGKSAIQRDTFVYIKTNIVFTLSEYKKTLQ